MLRRLGQFCYDHRKSVVAAWIVAFVSFGALSGIIGPGYDSSFEIPASDSRQGVDVLNAHFEGQGSGFGGSIVFAAEQGVEDPEVQAAMEDLFAAVDEIEGVSVTSPYSPEGAHQIAAAGPRAGQIAFASVDLTSDVDQTESAEIGAEIVDMLPEVDGLRIEVGGAALGEFEPPESELIGLAFAIVVLILAFGSVLAMGIPVGMAVSGVGIGIALVTLLSNVMTMPDFATTIGAMIGLGVGIDYALFVVSRYRETTRLGLSPRDAIAVAMDTAGRAVLFAGLTVVISLLGMLIIGLPFISGLGIGAAVTVTVTMLASVTLLPALLGLFASRLELTRWRGLIAAGLVAVALLGIGLGQPALVLALPLAVVVLLVGSFWAPLKREVPRRAGATRAGVVLVQVEPHRPAPPVALGHLRRPRARAPGVALALTAARLLRRGQLQRGHHDPPGVRPARRGLRPRLQRAVPRRGRGRRRRLGAAVRGRGRRHRRHRRRDLRDAADPRRPRLALRADGAGDPGDVPAGRAPPRTSSTCSGTRSCRPRAATGSTSTSPAPSPANIDFTSYLSGRTSCSSAPC